MLLLIVGLTYSFPPRDVPPKTTAKQPVKHDAYVPLGAKFSVIRFSTGLAKKTPSAAARHVELQATDGCSVRLRGCEENIKEGDHGSSEPKIPSDRATVSLGAG